MLFNTLQFAIFFIIVYSLYVRLSHRWQNRMLLVASYVFYGTWDWRFLSLLFISTLVDYYCARQMGRHDNAPLMRKRYLQVSIITNLTILGFFKYFNFFSANLIALLPSLQSSGNWPIIHIILPVGISFYTFQAMSYTIDVYYRRLPPEKSLRDFALYVSFFPQLVAGPIERATHLLPQVTQPRRITRNGIYSGSYLIFWGLFQKVFVADNLAKIINPIFASPGPYQASDVLLAVYAFAFQIFCDFSGYSDIARGLSQCMGFDLMINFRLPYFATNPQEFWRRWHISLSTWLRDYLYIPLGGNRNGTLMTYRNIALTMFLGGLWHGAAWTFVFWGMYHGLLLIIHRLLSPLFAMVGAPRTRFGQIFWRGVRTIFFFHLVCFGWLIFRAQSLPQVGEMLSAIWSPSIFYMMPDLSQPAWAQLFFFTWILLIVQVLQEKRNDLDIMPKLNLLTRTAFYYICSVLIIIFGVTGGQQFIYFQF